MVEKLHQGEKIKALKHKVWWEFQGGQYTIYEKSTKVAKCRKTKICKDTNEIIALLNFSRKNRVV